MSANTVYVTYNRNSGVDEASALRLQTLSSLYGFSVELPAVLPGHNTVAEIEKRIKRASLVVVFALSNRLTLNLQAEIKIAKTLNKPVLIVRKNTTESGLHDSIGSFKLLTVDVLDQQDAMHNISKFIQEHFRRRQKKEQDAILGVLGVGLGLLLLGALASD